MENRTGRRKRQPPRGVRSNLLTTWVSLSRWASVCFSWDQRRNRIILTQRKWVFLSSVPRWALFLLQLWSSRMCICLQLLIPLILLLQMKSQTQLPWRRSHLPCVFELFAGPFLIVSHPPGPLVFPNSVSYSWLAGPAGLENTLVPKSFVLPWSPSVHLAPFENELLN